MRDGQMEVLLDAVADFIKLNGASKAELAEVSRRIDSIKIPEAIKGDPGKDADPDLIEAMVREAVAALPKPVDGKDADPRETAVIVVKGLADGEEFTPELIEAVHKKVAEFVPRPINGKDGINAYEVAVSLGFEGTVHDWMKSLDGKPGDPGEPGASVTADQVLPELRAELQKAIASIPAPKDGKDGDPGLNGKSVTVDDVRPLFDSAMSAWQLEFERRAMDLVQRTLDRIEKPKDGKNGRDALDLATLDFVVGEDFRTWTLSAKAGEQTVERTVHVPLPMFKGVWTAGQWQRGDIVAFGGSSFIARRDTTSKPETDDSWTLFTKRGRDGKDGTKAERSDPATVRFR